MVFRFEVWAGEDLLLARGKIDCAYGCDALAYARALIAASGAGRRSVRCDVFIEGATGPGACFTVEGGVCYG